MALGRVKKYYSRNSHGLSFKRDLHSAFFSATQMEMQNDGNIISYISTEAVMLEVYTPEAVKMGVARFRNGKAAVKVAGTPGVYLYVVTNKDKGRTTGKVTVK